MAHDDLDARLREAQNLLPNWYDALNRKWEEAEAIFASFNLPDPVWITYDSVHEVDDSRVVMENVLSAPFERDVELRLGFAKHDGQWRICHQAWEVSDDQARERPIRDCPLHVRVSAMPGLPLLIEEMVTEAERIAAGVESAVAIGAEALTQFQGRRN